jgi:hypothetical protein
VGQPRGHHDEDEECPAEAGRCDKAGPYNEANRPAEAGRYDKAGRYDEDGE